MKRILIVFALAVMASGSMYGQGAKEKTSPSSQIVYGKFTLGSINELSGNQIIKLDSLYILSVPGKETGKIVSYNVFTIIDGRGISEITYGNRLSKKQKILISKVKPGDNLYIEKIVVKYPGKEKSTLNTKITFKIKP